MMLEKEPLFLAAGALGLLSLTIGIITKNALLIGLSFVFFYTSFLIYTNKLFVATPSSSKPTPSPAPTSTGENCPSSPYNYCSGGGNIDKIFVNPSCPSCSSLIQKLENENIITGYEDSKVINCSLNAELCTSVKATPTVVCKPDAANIVNVVEGYCP